MGTRSEQRVIGDRTFEVSQLPARRALEMFGRLGRLLGPAAFEAIAKGGNLDPEADVVEAMLPAIAPAVQTLFGNLPAGELTSIAEALLAPATCDMKPIVPQMDELFQGQILQLLQVVAFAVEVNYRDFFDAGRGLLARRPKGWSAETSKGSVPT